MALLDLIEERRGPLEYDFRTRFHLPLTAVGGEIEFDEAIRLVRILRADPSSMLAADIDGWTYPLPRTDAILMDQYDLAYAATGAKNRKPYPRPFKIQHKAEKRGNAAGRSPAEVMMALRGDPQP